MPTNQRSFWSSEFTFSGPALLRFYWTLTSNILVPLHLTPIPSATYPPLSFSLSLPRKILIKSRKMANCFSSAKKRLIRRIRCGKLIKLTNRDEKLKHSKWIRQTMDRSKRNRAKVQLRPNFFVRQPLKCIKYLSVEKLWRVCGFIEFLASSKTSKRSFEPSQYLASTEQSNKKTVAQCRSQQTALKQIWKSGMIWWAELCLLVKHQLVPPETRSHIQVKSFHVHFGGIESIKNHSPFRGGEFNKELEAATWS